MKKNIALLAGGYSGEYAISVQTAVTIQNNIDTALYNVYKIIVTREAWTYMHTDGNNYQIDRSDFSLQLPEGPLRFDAVFMAIHGTPGEDGKMQGYLEMLGIPCTSCGAIVSGLTFNKIFCNRVIAQSQLVHVSHSLHIHRDRVPAVADILQQIQLPVFVKPAEGGSSLATTKVKSAEDIPAALQAVFAIESQAMIEEFVKGREFSIGVYRYGAQVLALPVTEIISSKEFFDYEAKYTPGVSREVTPAEIETPIAERIASTAIQIYEVLNAKGICRIDFILEEDSGKLYFLEINTIPGHSENSIVPQQVRASGMDLKTFYGRILEECLLKAGS
ncbi:MAG TPA: D-alanine--D-alanine ligase [Chitinophagaceae bacterium]|nr:D-alanine--D-alanine ligase [Chitinophagaceae bacterium]